MTFRPKNLVIKKLNALIKENGLKPGDRLPTIKSMAETFKVSTATIQEAIHELKESGVIESQRKRGIFVATPTPPRQKGNRVALLMASSSISLEGEPYPGPVIRAIREGMDAEGLELVPISLDEIDHWRVHEALNDFAGVFLFEVESDSLILDLRDQGIPMVSVDYNAVRMGIPSVKFDNLFGAFEATRYLQSKGHTRIIFLYERVEKRYGTSLYYDAAHEERQQGYELAMQAAGLTPQIARNRFIEDQTRETLLAVLGQFEPAPTALFCPTDNTAIRAARALQSLGYRIPESFSIVGFGDFKDEFLSGRVITSVSVDARAMGQWAARLMVGVLNGDREPSLKKVPTRLALGDSVEIPRTDEAPPEGRTRRRGRKQARTEAKQK